MQRAEPGLWATAEQKRQTRSGQTGQGDVLHETPKLLSSGVLLPSPGDGINLCPCAICLEHAEEDRWAGRWQTVTLTRQDSTTGFFLFFLFCALAIYQRCFKKGSVPSAVRESVYRARRCRLGSGRLDGTPGKRNLTA
ncbi:hypothetical protein CPLU01_13682 [Colletotrichum plurivorum]|uniref:Uncharacterized protein n=1 Tax=Colletotrichum plurivorum TaxID=2175906 RepID=A0A8H6JQA7_9PEZI|nr:hypothetical protein CPLU01_13682 [Colletotrichum plurivorum]